MSAPVETVLPRAGKPSIAVLPFDNLSGDDFAEVIQRDVTENVTTALSRLPDMLVTGRYSTLSYKDKVADVQEVAEELGVRYVLEGSVRRTGDQVRITAKLTDAQTRHNFWGESYSRELQDASAIQDEITLNVVTALKVILTEGAGTRIVRGDTKNPEAYSLVLRGLSLFQDDTNERNIEARGLFQQAVELEPDYTIAWHLLGYTHNASARRGWREDRTQERARAIELARKALALDPSIAGPYILLSTISRLRSQYNEAVAHGEKAVARAPDDAMSVALLGQTLTMSGRPGQPEEGLALIQRAIRLSPYTPPPILFYEALGYHSFGRYKEAMAAFESSRTVNQKGVLPLALFAITSADLGRLEEARAAAQALESSYSYPIFSAVGFMNELDYKDSAKSKRALGTLRQLGLKE